MRFHLLGLAHLPSSRLYSSCAFTQKNMKLSTMLMSLGHEVFFYGARSVEGGDAPVCTQFIETHTVKDIAKDYGDGDNRFEVGYAWANTDFRHDFNTARKPSTLKFNAAAIAAIRANLHPDDFLLCTQGFYQKEIADALQLFLTCEPGVGYRGSCHRFRAFESAYIQNFTYGSEHPFDCINGSYYDRVIPNYFDPHDVEYSEQKDDYYLFIGRMIKRKGILTAALACNALGKKLIIAGQGARVDGRGYLVPTVDPDFELAPGTWDYVGYVNVEQRKPLMAHAIATFTPTEYLECFGGTHIESMLSGTPPITTSFGVYDTTIPDCANGIIGFKCHTLQDFVTAAKSAVEVKPAYVRSYGERFLMDNVKLDFHKWFVELHQVWESAMDPKVRGWSRLWLS